MYRKAHWKVYKVSVWEEWWRQPQSSEFVLFQTLIIGIYQLHWSLEYMYIHKTTINLFFRASAIILKNISQYCRMYNNRIYIEKFYCTYILSITSVTSCPVKLIRATHKLYISTNLDFIRSTAASAVLGPSVCVFPQHAYTTHDLRYKNRYPLVSWQLDVQQHKASTCPNIKENKEVFKY